MCRRGVSGVEMNVSVEHFVTRCELACLMQELIGSYIMMEEYFMRQMVVKVWRMQLSRETTFRRFKSRKVHVDWYSAPLKTRLWCATAAHSSALISVQLVLSQTPADTARTQTQASVSHDVPVYSTA